MTAIRLPFVTWDDLDEILFGDGEISEEEEIRLEGIDDDEI